VLHPARFVSLLLATSIVAGPLSAAAQYAPAPYPNAPPPVTMPPPPAPQPRVGVRFESDTPQTEYRVYAGRHEKVPWFQCTAPCSAEVPPGEYRFETTGPDLADGSVVANVSSPTRVSTQGGSKSAKSGGLVLGIVGSAITAIGLVGLLIEATYRSCGYFDAYGRCQDDPSTTDSRHKGEIAFGVVAGVGAVLATIGWIEFASNRTHMDTQTFAPPPPTTTVGVAPTTNGAVIGAMGAF
jgi:hypothetical protein